MAETGNAWGAHVLPVEAGATKAHLERLTDQARRMQHRSPAYLAELTSSTHSSDAEGVPMTHVPDHPHAFAETRTESYDRFPTGERPDPVLEPEPCRDALLLVCTSSDDAISRVCAGETLSAVWVQATQENLAVVPLSQAIEVEETRHELQMDVLGDRASPSS
jgi:hypothetical protein